MRVQITEVTSGKKIVDAFDEQAILANGRSVLLKFSISV